MSDALNLLRNELTRWYASLDARTQGFFEAAYAQAPAAVAVALGGGQVGPTAVDDEGYTSNLRRA